MEGSAATAPSPGRRPACARPLAGRRGGRRTARDDRLCDLIEAIGGDRDHAAFTELFRQLASSVKNLLQCRGASWAVAEELMQETMLSVWRHAATFDRRRASVSTWVLTIAGNKQLDLVRGERRLREETWQPPDPAPPDGEQVLHAKQSGQILHCAIQTLSRDRSWWSGRRSPRPNPTARSPWSRPCRSGP